MCAKLRISLVTGDYEMANFVVTAVWQDEDGDVGRSVFHVVGSTLADAESKSQNTLELADILSGAKLMSVSVAADIDISGWTLKASADVGSDVEIGGRFIFESSAGYKAKISIPGFLKDSYTGLGGLIDTAQTAVSNFITAVTVTNALATSHYEDLVDFVLGYEIFGGKR
jgi:hypothetical protein